MSLILKVSNQYMHEHDFLIPGAEHDKPVYQKKIEDSDTGYLLQQKINNKEVHVLYELRFDSGMW